MEIKKATLINAGNYQVSVGTYSTGEIAIISKSSGEFVRLEHLPKKGGVLRKIKRKFKIYLNSEETLTFSHLPESMTLEMIKMLKKK